MGSLPELYRSVEGAGEDLVLVHGWALHSAVWDEVAAVLAQEYRVTRIDLPGHGRSPSRGLGSLDAVVEALHQAAPEQAVWVGWSLGGQIAMHYALRFPKSVRRLIWVGTNARFVQTADWSHAMAPEVLGAFADGLETDYKATLNRFLSLQFRGVRDSQAALRRLRAALLDHPPASEALRDGLALLREIDLRAALVQLECPLRLILGELDTLVPAGVGADVERLLPTSRSAIIKGAGHAPFLSNRAVFIEKLKDFLHD